MNTRWILLIIIIVVGSCSYTQKLRDGKTAVQQKQYAVAIPLLKKEFEKAKLRVDKGKIAFLLAESYNEMNQSDESIDWYQTAYDYAYGVEALKANAYALKKAERYEEAIEAFTNLGFEIGSPYEYRREIQACQVAQGWADIKQKDYDIELMAFNSSDADYSPMLYLDEKMVITSDRGSSTGDDTYNWTGNDFSDLFLVDLNSNTIEPFEAPINTPDNEGTVAFNQEFTEMYITRCFGEKKEDAFCQIMKSDRIGDSWSIPIALPFMKEGINYGHPCLSEDGQTLYFSSNDPEGWGGYDIYQVEKTEDGWGTPDLLGRSVNSPGNEKFPTIDGDTLYFSSDHHTGMGGLDIFKVYRLRNGSWSSPYNLKSPINSGGDDFGLVVLAQNPEEEDVLQLGYFTSTRADGAGGDDIYLYKKYIPPPAPPQPEPEEIVYKMILNVYVLEKIFEDPADPNSGVLGRKPLPGSKVLIRYNNENQTMTVGEDGVIQLALEKGTNYSFLASKPEYLSNDARFTTIGIGEDPNNPVQEFELEIVLDKIFLNQEIVLENIYYDFDKDDIRDDAKPTLDELARNLQLNPGISIQLASHTDCRGSDRYNEDLSQRRAQSAVNYLIEKGIGAERLSARGYGESQPAVDCICGRCTEEEHQENRRTTFKILDQ